MIIVLLLFAKGRKNSLEKIQQSNTIGIIKYHRAKSDTVFQRGTLSQNVSDTVKQEVHQICWTLSRAGKRYLIAFYESVLILTILHHIVTSADK